MGNEEQITIDPTDLNILAEKSGALSYVEQQIKNFQIIESALQADHLGFWNMMVKKYNLDPNTEYSVDRVNNKLIRKI